MLYRRAFWLAAAAGLVLLAGIGASLVFLWKAEQPRPAEPAATPKAVAVRISQATVVVRHQGKRQAEISADHIEVSADQRTATFTGRSRVVVYVGDKAALTVTGERIVLDRHTQDVRVEGGLRITTPQGISLVAQWAFWDQATQVVNLVGGVELTFPVRRRS